MHLEKSLPADARTVPLSQEIKTSTAPDKGLWRTADGNRPQRHHAGFTAKPQCFFGH
jgi:hypothetical protein